MNRDHRSGDEGQSSTEPRIRRATDDRDEAERIIGELYLPNRLDLSSGSGRLCME